MGPFRQFSGIFHSGDDRGLSSLFAQPPYRSRSSGSCRTSRRRSYNTMSPPCRSQPWPGGLRRGIVGGRAGAIGWTRTGHKRPSERGPRKRPTWRRAVGQGFAPASACGGTCGAGPRRRSASCTAGGWNTKSELGVPECGIIGAAKSGMCAWCGRTGSAKGGKSGSPAAQHHWEAGCLCRVDGWKEERVPT